MFLDIIMDQIYHKNSSFPFEVVQGGKTLISIFQEFSASIHWAPGENSMIFWDFATFT